MTDRKAGDLRLCDSMSVRRAVTLIELLVVMGIVGVVLAIVLPAVQAAREASRRVECQSRLRQIGIAVQNYHSAFQYLPPHGGGTAQRSGIRTVGDDQSNHHRLSFHVAILPFLEQRGLWDEITTQLVSDGKVFPPMGPVPWFNELALGGQHPYGPWQQELSVFRCPSDPGRRSNSGTTNYAACLGDGILDIGAAYRRPQWRIAGDTQPKRYDDATKRGCFANWHSFSFRDCEDGLSHTVMVGEIVIGNGRGEVISHFQLGTPGIASDPLLCLDHLDSVMPRLYRVGTLVDDRGSRWADGAIAFTGFTTVLPPNSPSCAQIPLEGEHPNWLGGVASASSRHVGGVHVCRLDGSVSFITNSINAQTAGRDRSGVASGNIANPPGSESPYGVWGAMGTRAGRESVLIHE